ncbi:MAG TPA: hypothetical protein VML96_13070 [Egibacteraceae bacterium]|nr:hypothetical protein [Egibacteraceae bacterium]
MAASAEYIVNSTFVALAIGTVNRMPARIAARHSTTPVPRFATDFAVITLLGILLAVAYEAGGWAAIAFAGVPMWLGYRLLRQLRETADRAEALAERVRDLEVLERLNQELHSARYDEHACRITAGVLGEALGGVIECDPNGEISDGLNPVPVPDSGAVLGVDPDASDEVVTVTQLAAGTLATVLRRLAAEYEIERLLFRQQGLADRILVENIGREASIADTLEDDMLQHLAAGLMQLGNARACLRLGHQERADQLAGISEDLLDNAISRGREAVAALRDATHLGDDQNNVIALDVGALLTRLVDDTSIATALRCTLTLPDPPPKLPPLLTIAAVQIANGCLTAAAQTGAVQAHLQLGVNGHLILEVRADPGGFQQPPRAIVNRVQLAGGTVTVHLDADNGDLLQALIPLVGPVQKAYA